MLLFHSYGSYHDSKWIIKLKGWTFQTNSNSKRSNILRSISRRMLSPINGSTEHQRLVFDTRTEGLLSSVLPKCACTVAIISQKRPLIFKTIEEEDEAELNEFRNLDKEKLKHGEFPNVKVVSDENGLFNVTFEISQQDLEQFGAVVGEQGVRIFAYIQDAMDEAHSFSYCPFIPPKGVSIISDVDDTIKESSVHKGIIAATKVALFEDMKDVPGMVDCYNMLVFLT